MGLNINVSKCELIAQPGCHVTDPTLLSFQQIPSENAELLGAPLFPGTVLDLTWAKRCDELTRATERLASIGAQGRLNNKSFLIWLLTTRPYLEYVATLPCNLLLIADDINVSQGSVATYARCGWICNNDLSANLQRNLPVKKNYENRLRFDRNMATSLWPHFLAHPP